MALYYQRLIQFVGEPSQLPIKNVPQKVGTYMQMKWLEYEMQEVGYCFLCSYSFIFKLKFANLN